MRASLVIGFLAVLAGLGGCASEIEQSRDIHATKGTPFTQALSEEYQRLATYNADYLYDWDNANHFAHKALAAADGQVVPPEDLVHWHLPADSAAELTTARANLMKWLEGGGRDQAPEQAARAQVRFDCWIQTVTDPQQAKQMTSCRKEFLAALGPTT